MLWWIFVLLMLSDFECCMVCAFMLLNRSVTCVLDVDDTCWRLWGTRVIVWERGVMCVQWFPVALVVCEVSKIHVKWRVFSNKVHLNRCLFDITGVSLSNKKSSNSIHISRDLGLCWSRSPYEPWSLFWRMKMGVPTLCVWPSQTWRGVVLVFLLLLMACPNEFNVASHQFSFLLV